MRPINLFYFFILILFHCISPGQNKPTKAIPNKDTVIFSSRAISKNDFIKIKYRCVKGFGLRCEPSFPCGGEPEYSVERKKTGIWQAVSTDSNIDFCLCNCEVPFEYNASGSFKFYMMAKFANVEAGEYRLVFKRGKLHQEKHYYDKGFKESYSNFYSPAFFVK